MNLSSGNRIEHNWLPQYISCEVFSITLFYGDSRKKKKKSFMAYIDKHRVSCAKTDFI